MLHQFLNGANALKLENEIVEAHQEQSSMNQLNQNGIMSNY